MSPMSIIVKRLFCWDTANGKRRARRWPWGVAKEDSTELLHFFRTRIALPIEKSTAEFIRITPRTLKFPSLITFPPNFGPHNI
jgi:hypothetical protein